MRALVVAPYWPPREGWGEDWRLALEADGHSVRCVGYRRLSPLYKNKGVKTIYQRWIRRGILALAAEWKPNLVLVLKGESFRPAFIHALRDASGAAIVNVFIDNPLYSIPFELIELYDLFCTKERYAIETLRRVGLKNLRYLPCHCVPTLHYAPEPTPDEEKRFSAEIGFTGNYYPYRGRFFAELADLPITIWGRGWDQASPQVRAGWAGRSAWGREKPLSYSLPKIVLNLHHPLNDIFGVNERLFEVASCGGFQLTDWREDVGRMFEVGKEIVTYQDAADCRRLIEYYLGHPDERAAIAAAGQRRAHREHTVSLRLAELLAMLRMDWRAVKQ